MKNKLSFVLLAVLLFSASAVVAQVTDTDYLEQMRADISADRQALVAANLGLTDAEGHWWCSTS